MFSQRMKGGIRDDPFHQIFQTILCLHCKPSTRQVFPWIENRSSTLAEDALENEIDILQMISKIEQLFEFGAP